VPRDPSKPDLVERALQLAGAVAGGVFFFYLIGGVVTWRRFHTLGLADEASVAALPRSGLLVSGLLAMRHPIVLALITWLLYRVLAWRKMLRVSTQPAVRRAWWRSAGGELAKRRRRIEVALAVVLVVLLVTGLLGAWDDVFLISIATLLAIGASELSVRGRTERSAVIGLGLVLSVGIAAGAVQYFHLARPPTHLEPVALFLDGRQKPAIGYLIADASGFVYVAPRLGPCQVKREVDAYRRQDVGEIHLGRRIKVWPADQAPQGKDLDECMREEAKDRSLAQRTPPGAEKAPG
jgi:hypothetical protein